MRYPVLILSMACIFLTPIHCYASPELEVPAMESPAEDTGGETDAPSTDNSPDNPGDNPMDVDVPVPDIPTVPETLPPEAAEEILDFPEGEEAAEVTEASPSLESASENPLPDPVEETTEEETSQDKESNLEEMDADFLDSGEPWDAEDEYFLRYSLASPSNLSGIQESLDVCAELLAVADVLLALLVGCICASIFGRFFTLRW